MTSSQRRRYGRKVEKINRKYENFYQKRVERTIQAKANAAIARLRDSVNSAFHYLTTDLSNPVLGNVIKNLYRDVGLAHARRINEELRAEPKTLKSLFFHEKRLGFNIEWTRFVNDYLAKFLFEKITFEINRTTKEALMRAIQTGIDKGLGVDDIIRNLQDWPYKRFQAARIVRTEINRAANVGAMAGGSTFGFEQQKEWIAAKDNRTRGNPMTGQKDHANHWGLDGDKVDENGLFVDSRNGDHLRFPGDPNASAASVINCRCTVALVAKRDERGRLIPKKSRVSVILPGQIPNRRIITI